MASESISTDPVDPDAHLYDDSEEGADEVGDPVTSVDGSEESA